MSSEKHALNDAAGILTQQPQQPKRDIADILEDILLELQKK